MTIFERIKNKANQALQNVGNFIDRDKVTPGVQLFKDRSPEMPGNQIIPGGFQGGVDRVKQAWQQDPGQFNLFTASRRGDLQTGIKPLDRFNQGLYNTTPAKFTESYIIDPLLKVPENINTILDPNRSKVDKGIAGLSTVGAFIPGVDDAIVASYFSGKEKLAGNQQDALDPQYESSPLGDILRNRGYDGVGADALDVAELPLLFGGMVLAGGKGADNFAKRADETASLFKRVNGAEDVARPLRTAKNTIFVTPSGTAIKPKVQPKTSVSLEKILQQAEDVIPGGTKQSDEFGGFLTAGKQTPQLPPGDGGSVSVTQKGGDNFFKSLRNSKDVNTFDKIRLSRQQRLEKAMPKNVYAKIKTNIVDRKNKLLAESIDWGKKYENVLENLPIKIGSDEDKLIRQFNAGNVTADDLVAQVGEKKAAEIVGAHEQLRGMYDEMIGFINQRRSAEGLSEIPYKEDFLSQIGNKRSGNLLEDLFFGKDTTTGEFSKGIFKKQGETQDFGAIDGMMNYLDYAKRAGFTDLVTPKLDEYIGLANKAGADPSITRYLDDYRNEILGIRDSGFLDKASALTGKVRGAAVLGNVRSLVAQSYNLPQAISNTNPKNFVKGMFSKSARTAEAQSPLLKTLSDKTPAKLLKGYDKFQKPAVDALQTANNITARSIWRAFYEQGTAKGVDDVVQYADDLTVELMGDRRLGELGAFHQSALGKILSPFTIEPQAAANKLIKNIGEKKYGTVLGTLAAWRISNDLIENFGTGDRPFIDPVDMFNSVYEQWYGSEEKEPSKVKAVARVFTEVSKLAPILQSPMFTGAKLALGDKTRDIFGTEDPTWMNALSLYDVTDALGEDFNLEGRNITGNKVIDVPWNLASKVTPYTNQLARTAQAAISQGRGYTESRKGNPMYETPDNLFDQGRALLFGQNSTKEARDMFNNEFDWGLYGKQSEVIDQIPTKEGRVEYLRNARQQNIEKNQLQSMLDGEGSSSTGGFSNSVGLSAFDSKKATSESIEERMDAYKSLNSIINDETLPEEYKDQAIKASGADEKDVLYYNLAAKDVDVKLQNMLPVLDGMEGDELFQYLSESRRVIGGKQLLTSTMIDYLYDRDYISNGQRKALKALKYDEITNEFYYKKSYKGGGSGRGGRLSYKQALNLFKVDLPKYSDLKSMTSILNTYDQIASGTSQTARDGEILLSDILQG